MGSIFCLIATCSVTSSCLVSHHHTQCHIIIHSVTSSYTVSHHHTQCHIIIHSVTSSYIKPRALTFQGNLKTGFSLAHRVLRGLVLRGLVQLSYRVEDNSGFSLAHRGRGLVQLSCRVAGQLGVTRL
jgi:hypothetical protein